MAVVIESAEVTMTQYAYTQNYTIANVGNVNKVRVVIQVNPPNGVTDEAASSITPALTSTTNLQLRRESWGVSGQIVTVYYHIIVDDDQTVEHGEATFNQYPKNITVSDVGNLNEAYSIIYFRISNTSAIWYNLLAQHTLNATTNLKIWTKAYSLVPIGTYQIVKNSLLSVQSIEGTATETSYNVPISTINESKTILRIGFDNIGSISSPNQAKISAYNTATNIKIISYSSGTLDYTLYVISDNRLKVQSVYESYTASSNVKTIASVDLTKTYTLLYGEKNYIASVNTGTLNLGQMYILAKLLTSTSVDIRRSNNGGAAFYIPWAVIEYTEGGQLYPFLKMIGNKIGKKIGTF